MLPLLVHIGRFMSMLTLGDGYYQSKGAHHGLLWWLFLFILLFLFIFGTIILGIMAAYS